MMYDVLQRGGISERERERERVLVLQVKRRCQLTNFRISYSHVVYLCCTFATVEQLFLKWANYGLFLFFFGTHLLLKNVVFCGIPTRIVRVARCDHLLNVGAAADSFLLYWISYSLLLNLPSLEGFKPLDVRF